MDETDSSYESASEATPPARSMKQQSLPWYKRKKVLLILASVVMLISIGLVVAVVILVVLPEKDSSVDSSTSGTVGDTVGGDPPGGPVDDTTGEDVDGTGGVVESPSPTASPTVPAPAYPLSFYAMGDIPYNFDESLILQEQMVNMTQNRVLGSAFTVHVGDMMKGFQTGCEAQYFNEVWGLLRGGPLPTLVLAGDNDYLDCPDPELGWANYQAYFCTPPFEDQWLTTPEDAPLLDVTRWTEPQNVPTFTDSTRTASHPEMFSFVEDGVLFVSMLIMSDVSDAEYQTEIWSARLADSAHWVGQQLEQAKALYPQLRGVVMFGHSKLIATGLRPYFEGLQEVFFANQHFGPVLYIHGDGHKYQIEENYISTWPTFTGIQVDQGASAEPLLITIASQGSDGATEPLTADPNKQQVVIGNGLFLVDRQNGLYP